MQNLLKNKKMLLGLLVVGAVAYYLWNMKHENKEKAGILPADES
jgi:Tfp pilus assembly protein PilW